MNGAQIVSGIPGRTIEAGGFPEGRSSVAAPTAEADGTSPSHPGAEA